MERVGFLLAGRASVFRSVYSAAKEIGLKLPLPVVIRADKTESILTSSVGDGIERSLPFTSRAEFSARTAESLQKEGVGNCVFLFDRIVTGELFDAVECFNIHPSLLPSYPGVGAVDQARDGSETVLGATSHVVTADVDGGAIVNQIGTPMSASDSLNRWNNISFLQKCYLLLSILEASTNELRQNALKGEKLDAGEIESTEVVYPLRETGFNAVFEQIQENQPNSIL